MESHAWTEELGETPVASVRVGETSRVARNVFALASGQVVTWTMTLAWTLVVPRLLGPTGVGLIITAWSVTGLLAILLGFGTKNYLVRAIVVENSEVIEAGWSRPPGIDCRALRRHSLTKTGLVS